MPLYHYNNIRKEFMVIFFGRRGAYFTVQLRQGNVLSHLTFRRVHSEHASRFLRIEKLIFYKQ